MTCIGIVKTASRSFCKTTNLINVKLYFQEYGKWSLSKNEKQKFSDVNS